MKTSRHERKKEEILDTAFYVWSRDQFADMTLQKITDELGTTKQSLYRYFKGKDDLLAAMAARVYRLAEDNKIRLDEITSGSEELKDKLKNSLTYYHEMLLENSVIMRFSGYLYRKRKEDADRINEIHEEAFRKVAENLDIPLVAVHYLNSMFVLLFSMSREPLDIDRIVDVFFNGIKGESYREPGDLSRIVQAAEQWRFQKLFGSEIQRAVYLALKEAGDLNISMEQVAEKAGMRKSSLYNYFESKEEMIRTTVLQMRESLVEDQNEFLENLETIEDRLYGNFIYTDVFFRKYPDTIDIMDRLMSENSFKDKTPEKLIEKSLYVAVIRQAVEEDFIRSLQVDYTDVSRFVNLALILEIRYLHFKKIAGEERSVFLMDLYNLMIHGLNGLRREK